VVLLAAFHVRESNLTESFQCVKNFTIRPIAIKYQNGIAASEIFRCDRRGAALRARARRLRVAQPALFAPDSGLEKESLQTIRTLPRGVKLNAAEQAIPGGCARVLQELSEAAVRAGRVQAAVQARCVSVYENASWRRRCSEFLRAIPGAQPTPNCNFNQMRVWHS